VPIKKRINAQKPIKGSRENHANRQGGKIGALFENLVLGGTSWEETLEKNRGEGKFARTYSVRLHIQNRKDARMSGKP